MLPAVMGGYVDRCIRGLPLVNEGDRPDWVVLIPALSDQRSAARPIPGWCVNE